MANVVSSRHAAAARLTEGDGGKLARRLQALVQPDSSPAGPEFRARRPVIRGGRCVLPVNSVHQAAAGTP